MPIDYHRLKSWPFTDIVRTYSSTETMLYALSLGLGHDPLDKAMLPFVYEGSEDTPRVLPTMAVVLGYPGFWMQNPASGIDWIKTVHGENHLTSHRPLPPKGTIVGRSRVTRVVDKGRSKGAIVTVERTISDHATGELYARIQHVSFCRGEGGYSETGQPSDDPLPPLPATPESPPQAVDDRATLPECALLYRLLADRNPLHADPKIAAAAGFARPILHGLATYGIAAASLVRTYCGSDPRLLRSIDTRFSAPIYPGETVRTEMWRDAAAVRFRCRALERDVVVLSHGNALISTSPVA